ncbi:SusC/RagA family TonB-linked outer membrane protein [Saccharicrinis aurantiacus]|uniref:SusC/RagA family TonB-linked outer membrane protein n=1 Tax=Saccharicrinis aurantiacus TaxID=1849719 RepID=UPI002492417D|nr:TonB-dependent receptor [Saccharicrinis aurantiacus]
MKKKHRLKLMMTFAMLMSALLTFAQQTTIQGIVTDAEGAPLPGVTVFFTGTTSGTITDSNGKYTLKQEEGTNMLTFSFIGMETQEVDITGKTTINVALQNESIGLNEVVAIGYGTAKKSDLTGAVTSVDTDDFDKIPATSPLQALQGRASGINITSSSGMPGASSEVMIRGTQSINGSNAPIYVVDGVITTTIDNLNPNNIASVSILKDASAAAIYGARAANGVIIVTTKRGAGAQEPTINFNAYYGVQNESNLKFEQLGSADFLELWTESHENAGLDIPWDNETLQYYDGVDTDWQDLMKQTGIIQSYDISVQGGSEKSNYFLSAGYLDQKGMIIETSFEKYTMSFNSDHKIGKRIKIGNSLNLYSTKREGSDYAYRYALRKSPMTRAYDEDGDYGTIYNANLEHIHANPVWLAKNIQDERIGRGLQGNIYLTLDLLKGLSFTARGSMDYNTIFDSFFQSGVPPKYGWEGTNVNTVEKEYTEKVHWIGDFILNYETSINDNHNIKALLGYSLEEDTQETLFGSRTGTPNNDIRYLGAGDPLSQKNDNTYVDWAFASVFGRINYDFKNKYLFSLTVRRDGTSRLVGDNKYGVFPSGSLAWRMSEEGFMQGIDWLDDLKLRASYGTLGNILSIGAYATSPSLADRQAVLNQGGALGYTLANAINPDLKWESAVKKNFGFDATMFNSKLYATTNFFIEDTYDLLFRDPLAPSTGLPVSPYINAGEVRNTGYEIELGYRQNNGDWSYDINANFSKVKNEVTDLEDRDLRTSGLVEGYEVNSFFGYKSNGLITDASQLDKYQDGPFNKKQIGDINLLDIDGYDENGELTGVPDGKIDAADRTLIGNKYPDFTYGMMGTVGYKNWSLQVQLQGVQGIDFRTRVGGNNDVVQLMSSWARNEDARVKDRYHETANPNGSWPRLSKDQSGSNAEFSEFWLEDASYFRIRNINLNYSVPKKVCQKAGMSSLGLYISVQNLYTFTNYTGPDVDSSSADSYNTIPQPQTWTVGLRASF